MAVCYIGINASRDKSTAQGLDSIGSRRFYLEPAMAIKGFAKLLRAAKARSKDLSKAKCCNESTG